MDDRLRRLQEALPGLTGDMPREFFRLAEVFLYDAFELSRESGAALAAQRYQKFRKMGAAAPKEEL